MSVLPSSCLLTPTGDQLFTVRTAHGTTWIVAGPGGAVTAAGPLVAGWALGRALPSVLAAAERRGAVISPCAVPEAVPA